MPLGRRHSTVIYRPAGLLARFPRRHTCVPFQRDRARSLFAADDTESITNRIAFPSNLRSPAPGAHEPHLRLAGRGRWRRAGHSTVRLIESGAESAASKQQQQQQQQSDCDCFTDSYSIHFHPSLAYFINRHFFRFLFVVEFVALKKQISKFCPQFKAQKLQLTRE